MSRDSPTTDKRCNQCGLVKPITEFTPYRTPCGFQRYRSVCKPCAAARTRAWYVRNKKEPK